MYVSVANIRSIIVLFDDREVSHIKKLCNLTSSSDLNTIDVNLYRELASPMSILLINTLYHPISTIEPFFSVDLTSFDEDTASNLRNPKSPLYLHYGKMILYYLSYDLLQQ